MMEAAGVTEELKARDPMRWELMNTLKAQEKEIMLYFLCAVSLYSNGSNPVLLRNNSANRLALVYPTLSYNKAD